MFDIKVIGFTLFDVSMTYTTIDGNADAKDSVMICPEADHVKTSIWPYVSTKTYLHSLERFSTSSIIWLNFVENKFSEVIIAPYGPSENI